MVMFDLMGRFQMALIELIEMEKREFEFLLFSRRET
jgi:hypothetical protein